jgi:putative copper export protein
VTLAGGWLTFLGVFLLLGAAGARLVRGSAAPPFAHRRLAVAGALLALVGTLVRLGAQVLAFVDPGDPVNWAAVGAVLRSGWGVFWFWQAGAVLAALALARGPGASVLAGALAVSATLPLTGHALEAPWGAGVGVTIMALHVVAGGLWLGTLGVLWLSRRSLGEGGDAAPALRATIRRFSPLALGSASLVGVTGAASAWWLVGGWSGLLHSDYGLRLAAKLVVLAALLAVAFVNWRVRRPALGTPAASARLWASVAVEVALAVAVLGITGSLITTAPPGLQ